MAYIREHSETSLVQQEERERNTKRIDLAHLSDEELAVLLQQDVEEAFDILVLRYKDHLLNYICRYIGSLETAEDLLQETFIRVYQKRMLYLPVSRFSTWLYTIASNLAKSELRRPYNRFTVALIREPGLDEDPEEQIPDKRPGPDTRTDDLIKNERLLQALASLPDAFREAVVLRDIQELQYGEICDILDLPLGTIKSRINRGRAMLQKMLTDIYD